MSLNLLSISEATSESFLNQSHTIMYRELLPFCLRHWILLSSLRSPLIYGGEVKLEDMRLAVLACSTKSYAEFLSLAMPKTLTAALLEGICSLSLSKTYSLLRNALYWRLWKKLTRYSNVSHCLRNFNSYVDDYLPQLPFWKNLESSNESKLDGMIVTAARLLTACTPDYIENMPMGKMLIWAMAKNESEGFPNKNLMTDSEVELFRSHPAFAEAV